MNEKQKILLKSLNIDITNLSAANLATLKQIIDREMKSREDVRSKYLAYHMAVQVRELRVADIKRALAPTWRNDSNYLKPIEDK